MLPLHWFNFRRKSQPAPATPTPSSGPPASVPPLLPAPRPLAVPIGTVFPPRRPFALRLTQPEQAQAAADAAVNRPQSALPLYEDLGTLANLFCQIDPHLEVSLHPPTQGVGPAVEFRNSVGGRTLTAPASAAYLRLFELWMRCGCPTQPLTVWPSSVSLPSKFLTLGVTATAVRNYINALACNPPLPPDPRPTPSGGDRSFGYLLGTRLEYRAELLAYTIGARQFDELCRLFPETSEYLKRGMADARVSRSEPPAP